MCSMKCKVLLFGDKREFSVLIQIYRIRHWRGRILEEASLLNFAYKRIVTALVCFTDLLAVELEVRATDYYRFGSSH